ncbi:hypothetical protein TRFO_39733 [Tritrichomonas foetus]|uniref:Uncharacterized protein n=1 Tax=Tritrichomonas foetus TaxID=1144522 RepID=A0A1J4J8Q3_9EUKA|nr:hypothetical protein TRFO_39733 [Tritrichomonas foetus]|eukprot:OHS94067.1 hypothetical protein TRFO_39733 [Tritrichomonas foetus]
MSKKGSPVAVPIIRPQSNSSKKPLSQKKLSPIDSDSLQNEIEVSPSRQRIASKQTGIPKKDNESKSKNVHAVNKTERNKANISPSRQANNSAQKAVGNKSPSKIPISTRAANAAKQAPPSKTEKEAKNKFSEKNLEKTHLKNIEKNQVKNLKKNIEMKEKDKVLEMKDKVSEMRHLSPSQQKVSVTRQTPKSQKSQLSQKPPSYEISSARQISKSQKSPSAQEVLSARNCSSNTKKDARNRPQIKNDIQKFPPVEKDEYKEYEPINIQTIDHNKITNNDNPVKYEFTIDDKLNDFKKFNQEKEYDDDFDSKFNENMSKLLEEEDNLNKIDPNQFKIDEDFHKLNIDDLDIDKITKMTAPRSPEIQKSLETLNSAEINTSSITSINSKMDKSEKIDEKLPEPQNITEECKNLLNNLSNINDENEDPQQILDEIMDFVQNWDNDVLRMNFEVYHNLTEKLIKFIEENKSNLDHRLFKATAICVRVMPLSEKKLLSSSLTILKKFSSQPEFRSQFVDCHLLEPLLNICFNNYNDYTHDGNKEMGGFVEMAKCAASILSSLSSDQKVKYGLLQHDAYSLICKTISPQTRKSRFTTDYSYFLSDVFDFFIVLSEKISDFSKYAKYSVPTNLLNLLSIYKDDLNIQNKISQVLRIILDFDENVEDLECEDLTPLFMLLNSSNKETVENAIFAISNAIQISDFFVDTIAELKPPLGVQTLCSKLDPRPNKTNAEILKCLAKLTSFKQGVQLALPMFEKVSQFLEADFDMFGGPPTGQTEIFYSLSVMKNFAYIVPDKVAQVVNGKLRFFCSLGAVQVIGDLAKALMKSPKGRKVCEEVRDLPQIASMF